MNVYPLPDGDTGRNLVRTVDAALARGRASDGTLAAVARAVAEGALRGAHGNSGVILSQLLAGLTARLEAGAALDGAALTAGLREASTRAVAALTTPAPGTMISFGTEVAAALKGPEVPDVVASALRAAGPALERTMRENRMNDAAGVVDAGAYGLWLLLAGAQAALGGAEPAVPALRRDGAAPIALAAGATDDVAAWSGGHCVQFVVLAPGRGIDELRTELEAGGSDSVMVVGDAELVKVHAHSARPEAVLAIGRSAGAVEDVDVEDLDAMVAEHERRTGIVLASPPRALAAIAVVPGPGIADAFRSLGVLPLRGGAGANPSVGELADAIARANATRVIVLPNDRNVILAAREAAKLASCAVDVLETTNVAQAIAALPYFEPARDGAEVLREMAAAARGARSIEVTRASRDAVIDGLAVHAGDALGLLDGRVVSTAGDVVEALAGAAARLEGAGILTVFTGSDVTDEVRGRAVARLRELHPDAELEVRDGGQPHYPFVVAAE